MASCCDNHLNHCGMDQGDPQGIVFRMNLDLVVWIKNYSTDGCFRKLFQKETVTAQYIVSHVSRSHNYKLYTKTIKYWLCHAPTRLFWTFAGLGPDRLSVPSGVVMQHRVDLLMLFSFFEYFLSYVYLLSFKGWTANVCVSIWVRSVWPQNILSFSLVRQIRQFMGWLDDVEN